MHAEVVGEGPDLVCLHGGIGTGRYHWSKLVRSLAAEHRVHLPDLPGHGRTPLPDDGRYDLQVLVAAVEAYLERLDGGTGVHVAGFSMGGHASLALAQTRPELFASLTMVGVSHREHAGLGGWRKRFDPDRLEREFPVWVRHLAKLHAPLGGEDAWRDVCRRDSAGMRIDVDRAALEGLACPVLLIRGDRDPAVEAQQYAELRALWHRSEELVVPHGGHDVQLTRHRLVEPALLDFLSRATAD